MYGGENKQGTDLHDDVGAEIAKEGQLKGGIRQLKRCHH